jgi:uncharacterized protein (DUF58 family)
VPEPLLSAALLERLERLSIHWRKSLPGLVGGHHASRFGGPGQEFLDHRQFHHGDDLRAVNWRAYLRLEKLVLKMFQLEPRVPVRILLDVSASMASDPAKFTYARQLAGALCYVGLVRLDAMTIQPFSDRLHDAFAVGGGRHRFQPVNDFLRDLKADGTTRFMDCSRQFLAKYPQRGFVIIVSDFMDDGEFEKPIQFIGDFGHEVMLLQLWADQDREPPWDGELELQDAETGQTLALAFDRDARTQYTEAFDTYAERVRKSAERAGGRYLGLPCSVPIEQAIFGPMVNTGAVA